VARWAYWWAGTNNMITLCQCLHTEIFEIWMLKRFAGPPLDVFGGLFGKAASE